MLSKSPHSLEGGCLNHDEALACQLLKSHRAQDEPPNCGIG